MPVLPLLAVLPLIVLFITNADAEGKLEMPPPPYTQKLLLTVVFDITRVPPLPKPPPLSALLPLTVLSVKVSVPSLSMPPELLAAFTLFPITVLLLTISMPVLEL